MTGFPLAPDEWFNQEIKKGAGIFDRKCFERGISHVKTWGVAIDIGAHVGTWALPMAKMFDYVIAIEPNEINRKFLLDNMARADLKNITVEPWCIGDVDSNCGMAAGPRNSGQYHVDMTESGHTMYRLDTITENGKNFPDIGFIKIDVEGYEYYTLLGASETIKRHKPVIMLEWNACAARYGVEHHQIDGVMRALGYCMKESIKYDEIWVPQPS